MKYKNKVSEIDAIFYNGSNKADVEKFIKNHCAEYEDVWRFICWWENGVSIRAYCGDFIIKLPYGKSLVVRSEVFNELFEYVKE